MSSFFLRTESIKPDEIDDLCVLNSNDQDIIAALVSSSEPVLLEGSRGTGKTFLMRIAENKIETEKEERVAVFVSFNASSLVYTDDNLQFYHWMLAKTLRALISKLRRRGVIVSQYSSGLLSNDSTGDSNTTELNLKSIISKYENSYKNTAQTLNLELLPDIEEVKEAIEEICETNQLKDISFFFDEAAHVFRPDQQRQFFNLFKDLRSPYITCNAAIYPGVTYFGDSFELIHDCAYKKLERDIRDKDYISYFKEIIFRQADDQLKDAIKRNGELFTTLALSCGGNPRVLIRTIQLCSKFNTSNVESVIKEFYREKIWSEHTELGEKYKGHKVLVDWGRKYLEDNIIPTIEAYNRERAEKSIDESTIYFWIHKDSPAVVKESIRLLSYTGITRKIDSGVKATRSELGTRYEIKYGCIISFARNPSSFSKKFFPKISIKKFPEYGRNHAAFTDIKDFNMTLESEDSFLESIKELLSRDIDVLDLLTHWQKGVLRDAGISTIEELHTKTENELISRIYGVGPVRSRAMKNAANAELLEYLSG